MIDRPDIYLIDDDTFIYEKCVSATNKQITTGSRTRIIVNEGEVGISYVRGKLNILAPNIYQFGALARRLLSTRPSQMPTSACSTGSCRFGSRSSR